MQKTWLWLEDQPESVEHLAVILRKIGLNIKRFSTPTELIDYLIQIEEKKPDDLKNIGFILDIMLRGQRFITCPAKWSDKGSEEFFPTHNSGYDAGVVFYEKIVMGKGISAKPLWNPPPPAIFLTALSESNNIMNIKQRINTLTDKWKKACNVEPNKVKIEWVRKWEANYTKLHNIFKEWEEI